MALEPLLPFSLGQNAAAAATVDFALIDCNLLGSRYLFSFFETQSRSRGKFQFFFNINNKLIGNETSERRTRSKASTSPNLGECECEKVQ
jgi:hypothetical protein